MNHRLLPVALGLLFLSPLHAGLTYVDATDGAGGNTTLADGSPLLADDTTGATTWRQRDNAAFGSGGTVFEGIDPSPLIKTTLSGLTPGTSYTVRVHFWDPQSTAEDWNVKAGFTSGTLATFTREAAALAGSSASVLASTLTYAVAPTLFGPESGRDHLSGLVGTAVADANGKIEVFVDDQGVTEVNLRTWYDGVSYESVAASNDVNYVDASTSNSTRRDGQTFAPAAQGNTTIDHNWETRTLGNGATVFESNADGAEDAPLLATTLTGLLPDTSYVLYAYFWHDGRNWRLKASADATGIHANGTPGNLADDFLPTSPLANFSSADNDGGTATVAPAASGTTFVTTPLLTEGNRVLRQAALGTATSNASGQLTVFIDDLAGVGEGARTWFDGVGYKRALPLDGPADEDGDGLTNAVEATKGTDPYLVDTDGDTHSDKVEVDAGSDPLIASSVPPPPPLPGDGVEIAPDGAWTWFNDERSIVHQGSLFSGYVKGNGTYGITRRDLATGENFHMVISTATSQQQDDHNNPSITVLPDGKLMVLYSKHIAGSQFYQRTSLVPLPTTIADWGAEIIRPTPAATTYANTYRLTGEGNALYNFHRCINFNPTLTISTDNGATWGASRQLLGTGSGNTRPYPRYCSNGTDRIDLIYTDGHPRDVQNSVYHLYYKDGGLYKTDGTLIDTLSNIPLDHDGGKRGNVIYPFSNNAWGPGDGPDDWIPTGRGWTWDVHYGSGGNPVCVFQVQVGTDATWAGSRIYYYYARWTGTEWQRKFIAQAGRGLYAAESDYGGGMCLDPEDPRIVYISTNAADPFALGDINNVPLRANSRYEIYRGFTADGGLTFTWTPVTENSAADNLRPIIPPGHGRSEFLVWFHGTYSSYTSFSTKVLARIGEPLVSFESWSEGFGVPATSPLDSDEDGLDNLLEFAFGGDPGDAASRPTTIWQDGSFSFPRPEDRSGIEWQVQSSDDLTAWDTVAILRPRDLPPDLAPGFLFATTPDHRAFVTPPPGDPPSSRFMRVKVVRTD